MERKTISETLEAQRIAESKKSWHEWGSYLSERQWGTVREDYSADGNAWDYFPHDHARSRTYRWGEDGLGGISDLNQNLCFAIALWNEKDPILKERLFGLTGNEGNHGEDVKEYYFYLANTPTHSYMKYLYKYPQQAYPYSMLVDENVRRRNLQDKGGMEFELLDTGIFDNNRYFDVFVEYAKNNPQDILIKINIFNRSKTNARICVLPTLWFRNNWSWGYDNEKPMLTLLQSQSNVSVVEASWQKDRKMRLYFENAADVLFTENETNTQRLYNQPNRTPFVKDGINEYIVHQNRGAVNPEKKGTKAAGLYWLDIEAENNKTILLRLCEEKLNDNPFGVDFESIRNNRENEMNDFYDCLAPDNISKDLKEIQKQAFAGMLWSKQYYHYVIDHWLDGDPKPPSPPTLRQGGRNKEWKHFYSADVLSMPDKWEYPWFAAWDLAFHAIPFAIIDPQFAKRQLHLLTREWFMHPNGQLPAYEWQFSDVNPPVTAWAALKVYRIEQRIYGKKDLEFLKRMFNKLLLYFTWWVNKKDHFDNNIFEGGFLGLDNISLIDRSNPEIKDVIIEQADGTSWMGMFCLNMLQISVEIAKTDSAYKEWPGKFLQHFFRIADAMNKIGGTDDGLWDSKDNFYYDKLRLNGDVVPLRVRSMIGLIPLYAIEIIDFENVDTVTPFSEFSNFNDLRNQIDWFLNNRKDLISHDNVSVHIFDDAELCDAKGAVLSFIDTENTDLRLRPMLERLFDENEFLSPYGVRSLSKVHSQPYSISVNDKNLSIEYQPAESKTGMFGGNSNWRGPIWMPVNYLLIEALLKFYKVLGDKFKIDFPTGSGNSKNLKEIAIELSRRLIRIFEKNPQNQNRPVFGGSEKFQKDPYWKDYLLFYEYFHGDNGAGIGASHQTGWTGLVAKLIQDYRKYTEPVKEQPLQEKFELV